MTQATTARHAVLSRFSRPTGHGVAMVASLSTSADATRMGGTDASFPARERQAAAIITARGQRFSIHQIGSMFGSE